VIAVNDTCVQLGLSGTQVASAETETLRGTGCEVLQEQVRLRDEPPEDVAPLWSLEVDGDRLLATVEPEAGASAYAVGTFDGPAIPICVPTHHWHTSQFGPREECASPTMQKLQ
jgi:hypothetical protein